MVNSYNRMSDTGNVSVLLDTGYKMWYWVLHCVNRHKKKTYLIFMCRISSLDSTFLRKMVFWLSVIWETSAKQWAVYLSETLHFIWCSIRKQFQRHRKELILLWQLNVNTMTDMQKNKTVSEGRMWRKPTSLTFYTEFTSLPVLLEPTGFIQLGYQLGS